ncbi:hypothetical protein MCOR25_005660 [Pyricularia grisea]|nr:hypothetical protein MCOR25_005660 [Pyricularia grisea]
MNELGAYLDSDRTRLFCSPLLAFIDRPTGEFKYLPYNLDGESENLENYEPGGFHPVHLGDEYDGRYRVVHKLYLGGFSTVWLVRDFIDNRWAALKIVIARESPEYEHRSVINSDPSVSGSRFFSTVERKFWLNGPNGRHLCLVFPFGEPQTCQLLTYSGEPPGPHGPDYIVAHLDFCASSTFLSSEICIIDFGQSFKANNSTLGDLPEQWKDVQFDEDGLVVWMTVTRIRRSRTQLETLGGYFTGYSEETDEMLKAFPKIGEPEASHHIDLLSKIFVYDPEKRPSAEEIPTHPGFHLAEAQ